MNQVKSIFQSKGVWGSLAVLFASVLTAWLNLDPKQSADLLALSNSAVTAGLQVASILGAALALYGRITATHKLVLPGNPAIQPPTTNKESSPNG